MEELLIALDTGGTKSHLVLADAKELVLGESFFEGMGLPVDQPDLPLPRLEQEVRRLVSADTIPSDAVNTVVVSLGGKNNQQILRSLKNCLASASISIFRESDGFLAQRIGKKYGTNVVLLAGTGCIAVASGPDGLFIADGWGKDIGDAGSAYAIGMHAICSSLEALEETGPLPLLAQRITGKTEVLGAVADGRNLSQIRDEIRSHILPLDRKKTADVSKIVSECADAGDQLSCQILKHAGCSMAATVCRAAKKASIDHIRVLILGGLTNCASHWLDEFKERSGAEAVIVSSDDMTVAALDYAKERISK